MELDKVICCDRGGNDNALAAAIMAGNRRDNNDALVASIMANRNNNNDGMWMNSQWMNNPFAYMMMMGMWRFMGFDQNGNCNGQNAQNIEMQNQLQAIRTQLQDNQNSGYIIDAVQGGKAEVGRLADRLNCNFDAVNAAICDIRASIKEVGGAIGFSAEKVINSVLRGNQGIIEQLKDCCCNLRESIASFKGSVELQMCKDTSLLRDGQRDITAAVTEGFSTLGYRLQQDKCDLLNAGKDNTQRIVDLLTNHWDREKDREINRLEFENSQLRQNNLIIARTGGYNNNNNNGCGCDGYQYNMGF